MIKYYQRFLEWFQAREQKAIEQEKRFLEERKRQAQDSLIFVNAEEEMQVRRRDPRTMPLWKYLFQSSSEDLEEEIAEIEQKISDPHSHLKQKRRKLRIIGASSLAGLSLLTSFLISGRKPATRIAPVPVAPAVSSPAPQIHQWDNDILFPFPEAQSGDQFPESRAAIKELEEEMREAIEQGFKDGKEDANRAIEMLEKAGIIDTFKERQNSRRRQKNTLSP